MIPVDLLIVGGLALDRFADGRLRPGGAVLHGARAARAAGWRVATVCVAGPEPEIAPALVELALAGPSRVISAHATLRFGIDERSEPRRLTLEQSIPAMRPDPAWGAAWAPAASLVAPLAGEIDAAVVADLADLPGRVRLALLQGWLRTVGSDRVVRSSPVRDIAPELLSWLGQVNVVLASREDLLADGQDPLDQLRALRAACGRGPALIVTLGPQGYLVELPGERARREPAPRVVAVRSSVGAGDAFAALLAAEMGAGASVSAAAQSAAEGVAAILEAGEG